MVWDWQSRPWCREEWRRGWGRVDTEPEMPLLQQNPFFKGSVVHSTYGGVGKGAEGESTVTSTAARIPLFPSPRPHPSWSSANTSQRQSLSQGNWDPYIRWCFPFPDRCVQCYAICVHQPQSPRGSAEPLRGKLQSQLSLCLFSILISGGHWPPPWVPCPQPLFSRSWTSLAPPHTPSPRPQD